MFAQVAFPLCFMLDLVFSETIKFETYTNKTEEIRTLFHNTVFKKKKVPKNKMAKIEKHVFSEALKFLHPNAPE